MLKWDIQETVKGGPFQEILDSDIFINCIYLSQPIPPFITLDGLESESRQLSVLVDVSCDPNNPYNPGTFFFLILSSCYLQCVNDV